VTTEPIDPPGDETFAAVRPLLAEHAELERRMADPAIHADPAVARKLGRRYAELSAVEQGFRDSLRVRLWIRAGRKADRPKAAAAPWRDRAGCWVEIAVVAGFNPVAKQIEHRLFVDCSGREDARSRGMARNFADREPLATGEGRSRVEAETAPPDRLPSLARLVAAA